MMVTATCHSDDYAIEISLFDATPWFEQATNEEILTLHDEEYGGDSMADEVAEFCAEPSSGVQEMFDYIDLVNKHKGAHQDPVGFECYVDEEEARTWIKEHRPTVWEEILRREEGE